MLNEISESWFSLQRVTAVANFSQIILKLD